MSAAGLRDTGVAQMERLIVMLKPLHFVRLGQNESRDDTATACCQPRLAFGNALVDDLGDGFLVLPGVDQERDLRRHFRKHAEDSCRIAWGRHAAVNMRFDHLCSVQPLVAGRPTLMSFAASEIVGPGSSARFLAAVRFSQATRREAMGPAVRSVVMIAGVIGHETAPEPPKRTRKPSSSGTLAVTGADPRPPKRRRVAAMAHFAGLDVSIEETAVCVVDDQGTVLMQCSVATEPAAIAKALAPWAATLKRAGHEAGSLSPWLHPELKALGVPAVCLETRQVRAAMSAQRNKTDATDALGLAHLMRTGWFRQAHVKTEGAYRLKLLLTHRRNLKRKFLDLENAIRHSLKSFGVKLHKVGRAGFEQAVRDASAEDALTAELMDCMLTARAALWRQYLKLHNLVVRLVARDTLCRRFMAIPGVGPVTALTFRTAIDEATRDIIEQRHGDPDAFIRSHVRRLEALRRAGHVERIDADHWKIPDDIAERGMAYDAPTRPKDFSIRTLSFLDLHRQVGSDGATWLDRELVAKDHLPITDAGFGREVNIALDRRAQRLVEMGHATAKDGFISIPRRSIAVLERQEVERVGKEMARRTRADLRPVRPW